VIPEKIPLTLDQYTVLFEKYRVRFIRFATSYIGDASIAEDIVMDAFMALWQKKDQLQEDEAAAYTLTAIKNRCLNYLRNQRTHHDVEDRLAVHAQRMQELRASSLEACDPHELLGREMQAIIQKAVDQLSPKAREIFIRSRYKDESYREISIAMDCSVKSVEYELSKSLKHMRKALREYMPLILPFI